MRIGDVHEIRWLRHGRPMPDGFSLSNKDCGTHSRYSVLIYKPERS